MKKTWTLKDIKDLISAMTLKVSRYGYRAIINVESIDTKDLHITFVPLEDRDTLPIDLLLWLSSKFGVGKSINWPLPVPGATPDPNGYGIPVGRDAVDEFVYEHKIAFKLGDLNINAYVV